MALVLIFAIATVVSVSAALPPRAEAQARYTARQTGDIVQLRDNTADMTVSVLTSVSNAYEIVVKGHNVIQTRFTSVDQVRARPALNGIPIVGPFANRLDEPAFYANGRKYNFDLELGNVRGPIPIHGFLSGGDAWEMLDTGADGSSAWVTNKLEFHRHPQYMAQWPFAHTVTMTYRLADGVLEVKTRIDNLSIEPMPVAYGFHPSFWLTDSVRDEWTLSVGARTHWVLDDRSIPSGQTQPITEFFPDPKNVALKDYALDHVFGDLERDEQGRALMRVKGRQQQLDVLLGPTYKAVVLWATQPNANRGGGPGRAGAAGGRGQGAAPAAPAAPSGPAPASIPLSARPETVPADRGYIAFEPMVGITNALNMAHKGTYKDLQSVPAGGSWEASFWIRPSGF